MPMKLSTFPGDEIIRSQSVEVVCVTKDTMYRRDFEFLSNCGKRACDVRANCCTIMIRVADDSGARNGCERNSNQQFGVVRHSRSLVSVRPSPVKNKFTVRMIFKIARRAAYQLTIDACRNMTGRPPGFADATATVFQRPEKFILQAGIVFRHHHVPLALVKSGYRRICC